MIVSIELVPDVATEAAVRADWDALAAAGLSSAGRHTGASNRPHVTLLVRPGPVRTAVAEFDPAPLLARPLPLVLGAPIVLGTGDRRVLARSVVPTAELLARHADVHAAAGPGDDLPHTAPGEWTPHVTLGRRMRLADLERALELLGDEVHGHAAALRRWDAASAAVTDLGAFADGR